MTLDSLLSFLAEEFSGLRAKNVVVDLAQFHRIQASPGYDEALASVASRLEALGIDHQVQTFVADGKTDTFGWISPPGWTIRAGELDQIYPVAKRLCRFDVVKQSILGQSAGGDGEGEVVHVGKGDSASCFEGADLAGKFVLSSGRPAAMLKFLKGTSAAGLIIYPDVARAEPSHDLVQYGGFFPRADEIPWLPMGFSISRAAAESLLADLSKGTVSVRGSVDADFVHNPMRTLEAAIPGTEPSAGEVLLSAHLCHPAQSANDNASGSGVMVEIARTLKQLSVRGELANSVRLLWIPEFNGAIPWAAANGDKLHSVELALNLDMVGQSPELIGEPLRVFRVPNTHPTFHNACFEPLLARIARHPGMPATQGSRRILHWIFDAPTGGSDHLVFQAPPASIPSAMVGHDDPYWHTDLDTIEKVDPTRLKATGILSVLIATLPTWGRCDGAGLAEWLVAFSTRELAEAARLSRECEGRQRAHLMKAALAIETDRARSLGTFLGEPSSADAAIRHLEATYEQLCTPTVANEHAFSGEDEAFKPKRLLDGPIQYAALDALGMDYREAFPQSLFSHHGAPPQVLANLANGQRDVEQITARLSLDFRQVFKVDDVREAVDVLVRIGYLGNA